MLPWAEVDIKQLAYRGWWFVFLPEIKKWQGVEEVKRIIQVLLGTTVIIPLLWITGKPWIQSPQHLHAKWVLLDFKYLIMAHHRHVSAEWNSLVHGCKKFCSPKHGWPFGDAVCRLREQPCLCPVHRVSVLVRAWEVNFKEHLRGIDPVHLLFL